MTKKRKVVLASAGSLILVVAALGSIVIFGYTKTPTFESLKEHPDVSITGTLAYIDDSDDGNSCLHVLPASGEGKDVEHCDTYFFMSPVFTKDGDVVISTTDPVEYNKTKYDVLDAKTLQSKETFSVTRESGAFTSQSYGDGTVYTSDEEFDDYSSGLFDAQESTHTVWVAKDPDGRDRIFSRKAPADYELTSAAHSPDKKWIVVSSSRGDILITDENGHVRELVHGHAESSGGLFGDSYDFAFYSPSSVAWFQPGYTEGIVDIAELKAGSAGSTQSFGHLDVTTIPL